MLLASPALAAEIRTGGSLDVPAGAAVLAVSTDPAVQQVLSDDLHAAGRSASSDTTSALTITVTLNQRLLRPGVSLGDVAPGDPMVLSLLRSAGAQTPPIGDSGADEPDPYLTLQRRELLAPEDPQIQQLREEMLERRQNDPLNPQPLHEPDSSFDTVIIARAASSASSHEFTVLAVVHPDEDLRMAKKLVAEQIANAILH